MRKLIFCITNDIAYDRRIQRCAEALSNDFDVEVIYRQLHTQSLASFPFTVTKITCWTKSGFLMYAEFNLRLLFKLLIRKMDVIVSVDYDTLIACTQAKKFKRFQLAFDAHEYFEESIEIVKRNKIRKFWKWVGKTFVPNVDLAYTVSQSIANEYEELHDIAFKTIRNVPNYQDKSKLSQDSERKIVLYQGVLNEGRKLELLIEAASSMTETDFWILGEGDISESLKSNATDNVTFYSWVEPERLAELTAQASLGYNLLDESSKSYYFSLANKFFDYLQAGVPSINNNFPEYEALNERYNCCYLENITETGELIDFVRNTLENQNQLNEKRKNARIAAEDLCWEKESEKLKEMFRKL